MGERNKQTNKNKARRELKPKFRKIEVKRGNKSISSQLRFLTWPSTHQDREAKPRAHMHHGSAMHYVAAFRIRKKRDPRFSEFLEERRRVKKTHGAYVKTERG